MIKSNNKNVTAFEKYAAEAATGSNKPYALMIKYAGLAACEGAIGKDDRDLFYARLAKVRPSATHKTLLDSKRSEAWSCVKLAFEYKLCASDIFANLEKAGTTPTGIYDIACSIRGKAHFALDAYKKKAISLHEDSGKAPSVEAMTAAIKVSNAYRNDLSGNSNARPINVVVGNMAKMLESFRDGKRDPKTGKPAKNKAGATITLPKLTSEKLNECITVLRAYETQLAKPANGKVVPITSGKRRAA